MGQMVGKSVGWTQKKTVLFSNDHGTKGTSKMCEKIQWEYHIIDFRSYTTECELDELGEEGWELCAAIDSCLLFKRPKSPWSN